MSSILIWTTLHLLRQISRNTVVLEWRMIISWVINLTFECYFLVCVISSTHLNKSLRREEERKSSCQIINVSLPEFFLCNFNCLCTKHSANVCSKTDTVPTMLTIWEKVTERERERVITYEIELKNVQLRKKLICHFLNIFCISWFCLSHIMSQYQEQH